jgi:hypothetical protein
MSLNSQVSGSELTMPTWRHAGSSSSAVLSAPPHPLPPGSACMFPASEPVGSLGLGASHHQGALISGLCSAKWGWSNSAKVARDLVT